MTRIKLTALPIILFSAIILLGSCRRDDIEPQTTYSKSGIVMSSAQENNPANTSSATGLLNVTYSKLSKTTDSVSNMHIHGLAPAGFNTGVVQNIVINATPPTTIFPQKTSGKFTFAKSGSLSASLFVDGVAIKEADLLNGMYYLNIHTATYPGGEIRGQIVFQ